MTNSSSAVSQNALTSAQTLCNSIEERDLPIVDLKPNPLGARAHSKKQRRKLEASIKKFGFAKRLVVTPTLEIIDGHARVEVAKKLGCETVPVCIMHNLSPGDSELLYFALNRIQEDARWKLPELGKGLRHLDSLGYELEPTGFDKWEIKNVLKIETSFEIRNNFPSARSRKIRDREIHIPSSGAPAASVGDLFELGDSRLAVGRLDADLLHLLFGQRKVSTIFTDILFAPDLLRMVLDTPDHAEREQLLVSFSGRSGLRRQLQEYLFVIEPYIAAGCTAQLLLDWPSLSGLHSLICETNFVVEACSACINRFEDSDSVDIKPFRLLLKLRREGGASNERRLLDGVCFFPERAHYPARKISRARGARMPAEGDAGKIELIANALMDVSGPDDLLFDPFCGDGSTLLAASDIGRACYALESDPLRAHATIQRWQKATGKSVVNIATGELFDAAVERIRGTTAAAPACSVFDGTAALESHHD